MLWVLVMVEGAPGCARGSRLRGESAAGAAVAGAVVGLLGELIFGLPPLGGPRGARALLRGNGGGGTTIFYARRLPRQTRFSPSAV